MPKAEIKIYREADGTVPLLNWLDNVPQKVQDKCIDKIELLAYQTTFDPVKRSGKVPGNMEIFPKEQFRAALIAMADVFSSKMCASSLVPVGRNKVGVVLIGGLNPPAAAAEAGIDVTNMAMSRLIDFERLQSFWEL